MDIELLNGVVKCTIIESFARNIFVIRPGFKQEFKALDDAKGFVINRNWEVNISFIKGSKLMREMQKAGNGEE